MIHFYSVKYDNDKWRPWVARIVGTCPDFGFSRVFIAGLPDYKQASTNWRRTANITLQFPLEVGWVVQTCKRTIGMEKRRFYRVTSPTELSEMTEEEVRSWTAAQ